MGLKLHLWTLAVVLAVFALTVSMLLNWDHFTKPYYAPLGYGDYTGAPDGTYEQGDWGSFDNSTNTWYFALCDHNGLGPLHGGWQVAEGVWVPVWEWGVFPVDARLLVTIQNNTITHVEVHSWREYGN